MKYSWLFVALTHGCDAAMSKMQSALSEYGITASLLLTICFPYLFDEPDAIKAMESSSPGRICFNICIWAAVTCFCLTNLLMICVADNMNMWIRESDCLAFLHRSSTIHQILMALTPIGTLFMVIAAGISNVQSNNNPIPLSSSCGFLCVSYTLQALQ